MRKRIVVLATLCVLGVVLPAHAQFNFKVTLPFAFQIENKEFPAGTYLLTQEAGDKGLNIRNEKGTITGNFGVAPTPTESPFEKDKTWLAFHRSGDKYFLFEIWARHKGWQLPVSSAEKQLRDSGKELTEVKVNVKM
jgi:hypothetical protein